MSDKQFYEMCQYGIKEIDGIHCMVPIPIWVNQLRSSTIDPKNCDECRAFKPISRYSQEEKTPFELKDVGKTPFAFLDFSFLAAMAECWSNGLQGTDEPFSWMRLLPWTADKENSYLSALMRHLALYRRTRDPKHLAAVACNANILWHYARKSTE